MTKTEIDREYFAYAVGMLANANIPNDDLFPRFEKVHKFLIEESPEYKIAFDDYAANYLKIHDLMTKGGECVPDFNPEGSNLDQLKGIALAAFHMATLVSRIPRVIPPALKLASATSTMFNIYKASIFAP